MTGRPVSQAGRWDTLGETSVAPSLFGAWLQEVRASISASMLRPSQRFTSDVFAVLAHSLEAWGVPLLATNEAPPAREARWELRGGWW